VQDKTTKAIEVGFREGRGGGITGRTFGLQQTFSKPGTDQRIYDQMDSIALTAIDNRMRVAQTQVPALSFVHDDSRAVQPEVHVRIGCDGNMQSSGLAFGGKIVIHVRLDGRTRSQPHQAHGEERTLKCRQYLLEIRASSQLRRIDKLCAGWVRVD